MHLACWCGVNVSAEAAKAFFLGKNLVIEMKTFYALQSGEHDIRYLRKGSFNSYHWK